MVATGEVLARICAGRRAVHRAVTTPASAWGARSFFFRKACRNGMRVGSKANSSLSPIGRSVGGRPRMFAVRFRGAGAGKPRATCRTDAARTAQRSALDLNVLAVFEPVADSRFHHRLCGPLSARQQRSAVHRRGRQRTFSAHMRDAWLRRRCSQWVARDPSQPWVWLGQRRRARGRRLGARSVGGGASSHFSGVGVGASSGLLPSAARSASQVVVMVLMAPSMQRSPSSSE